MTLPELSIRRHVLAWMMSGLLALAGLIGYQRLGVDRYPRVEFPIVSVTTVMPGASPEIVDASVTSVLESQVNSIPGIQHVQSFSSPGVSVINITFELDKDVDVAFNEVQAKVNQVLRRLPEEAEPPVVAKVQTEASPILWLALQGDRTQQQLNRYARTVLKKRLETIDGVGEVRLGGRRDRTIRVELDPARMAALGVTVQDVLAAFAREHVQMPGGFLVGGETERLLRLDLEFHRVADIAGMVVAWRGGAPVRLGDLADVVDGLSDARQLARFDGEPSAGLGIVKVPGANTVAIAREVRRRLEQELRPMLPPGMRLTVASDDSVFIVEMVRALQEHLVGGTLLAAFVVWLFLRNLRATGIIALAIPVSLLGAVAAMHFAGYTFNRLTLLGLLLLIGVVVDDAIVVLENVHRHRERGVPPVRAAADGTREVVFAVLASTLTLVAIFAPVIFMGGIVGRFFESFAVVVTVGVLVSWFVSMTLTPMLCARHLGDGGREGPVRRALARAFGAVEAGYRRLLAAALRRRWTVLAGALAAVAATVPVFGALGKTFVPPEDEGRFLVLIKTPLGSSLDYTDARLREVERLIAAEPGVRSRFTAIGLGRQGQANRAIAFVRLEPRARRDRSQQEIIASLQRRLAGLPGVRAFAAPVPIVGGFRGEPLQFTVSGPNLEKVAALAGELRRRLAAVPGMGRVDLDLELDLPQLRLRVDRTRAALHGVSPRDVALAVNVLAGGMDVAKYNDEPGDGERYDVRLRAREGFYRTPADLRRIWLRGRDGRLVRIDSVARFEERPGPAVIGRFDLLYAANFYASPDMPLGEAVARVRALAAGLLPPGYRLQFQGEAEEFGKTVGYIAFAFGLAVVLVYMVLASQFNSFGQPLLVMTAQPLAVVGGILALWLSGHTLNIFSMIGMVLLVGLVAKNAILLVDLTNRLRARGMGVDEALLAACPMRLRPVLMTSLTVVLALLPTALGLGAGGEANAPLAVAVVGGMVSSTLLTLLVVPALYSVAVRRSP